MSSSNNDGGRYIVITNLLECIFKTRWGLKLPSDFSSMLNVWRTLIPWCCLQMWQRCARSWICGPCKDNTLRCYSALSRLVPNRDWFVRSEATRLQCRVRRHAQGLVCRTSPMQQKSPTDHYEKSFRLKGSHYFCFTKVRTWISEQYSVGCDNVSADHTSRKHHGQYST